MFLLLGYESSILPSSLSFPMQSSQGYNSRMLENTAGAETIRTIRTKHKTTHERVQGSPEVPLFEMNLSLHQ